MKLSSLNKESSPSFGTGDAWETGVISVTVGMLGGVVVAAGIGDVGVDGIGMETEVDIKYFCFFACG